MYKEALSPQQEEAVIGYLEVVRNPLAIYDLAFEISEKYRIHPFMEINGLLYKLHSNIHLIAIPLYYEAHEGVSARLPHTGEEEYPYVLYVSTGQNEADELFGYLGTDNIGNLIRLQKTGLMVVKNSTVISRQMQSPFN